MYFTKLENLLHERDIPVRKFLAESGISSRTYYAMLNGDNISDKSIDMACKYLGVQPKNIMSAGKPSSNDFESLINDLSDVKKELMDLERDIYDTMKKTDTIMREVNILMSTARKIEKAEQEKKEKQKKEKQ